MKLAWRLTASAVLVAMVLAGCGNGGDETEATEATAGSTAEAQTTVDTATKDEYIAQGDAICADIQADAAELRRQAQELQAQSQELPEAEFIERAASFWGEQILLTASSLSVPAPQPTAASARRSRGMRAMRLITSKSTCPFRREEYPGRM